MSISITKYVDITSGVAGSAGVAVRQLIGRIFTTNPLVPPGSYLEFSSAADVGTYFSTTSEEYARAVFYFAFVSKTFSKPKLLSFAPWVSTARAPLIYGATFQKVLTTLQAITAGAFTLVIGGVSHTFSSVDLSGAASLTAVATIIQTLIQAQSGTVWSSAAVAYDPVRGSFNFTGGLAGANVVTVSDGAQNLGAALGWVPEGVSGSFDPSAFAIWANGSDVQTLGAALDASDGASDNFGSFLFMSALTQDEASQVGLWNKAKNVKYLDCLAVSPANASAWFAALGGIGGIGPTLDVLTTEYPEMVPMMVMAATNYLTRSAVQNYMYQQVAGLTASVTSDPDSALYDGLAINYYGQTQSAGQKVALYQNGVMWGGDTDPLDMNVYSNEVWLKATASASILAFFLARPQVPANVGGRSALLSVIYAQVIAPALFNGTIEVGKTLTADQINSITDITGDPTAWRQVQTAGYWIDVVIAPASGPGGRTIQVATYTLVYSKNDVVRKVIGSNILI